MIEDLSYDLKNLEYKNLISELDIRTKAGLEYESAIPSESLEVVFSFKVLDLTISKYHAILNWFNKYYPDVQVNRIFHRHTIIAEFKNESAI